MDHLDNALEFIYLRLHELLGALGEEVNFALDPLALHDFFPLLTRSVFSFLNNFPQLVAEDVRSLM
jgi:hypothetical protein